MYSPYGGAYISPVWWSIVGCAEPDKIVAVDVGTDMRGDKINGGPSGVVADLNCAAVKPGIAGDNNRESATAWAVARLHSSSHAWSESIIIKTKGCILKIHKEYIEIWLIV